MLLTTAYALSGLIALAIIFLGARFFWSPLAASDAFGIPNSPAQSTAFSGWLAVKGTRDIVSGLFVLLLMANGSAVLLGEFLLVASLIALGDMVTVLRAGGSKVAALAIHGLAGLIIIGVAAVLIIAAP